MHNKLKGNKTLYQEVVIHVLVTHCVWTTKACLLYFSNWLWVKIFRETYVLKLKTRFYRLFWTNYLISPEQKSRIIKWDTVL